MSGIVEKLLNCTCSGVKQRVSEAEIRSNVIELNDLLVFNTERVYIMSFMFS